MTRWKAILACGLLAIASGQGPAAGAEAISAAAAAAKEEEMSDGAAAKDGCSRFAFDLYGRLRTESLPRPEASNLFFSPYSLSVALAMTFAGSRGATEQEMARVLHFTLSQERLHPAFGRLQQDLAAAAAGEGPTLEIANALFGQRGVGFLAPFIATARESYGAGLEEVDFAAATEAARQTINAWVKEKTHGKIEDLIKPGILNALTELVLTNAIYFKGRWASEFKTADTRDAPFKIAPEKEIPVKMMSRKGELPIVETDDLQILELPYTGERLSMVILLPKAVDGLASLESGVSAAALEDWLSKLRRREVAVELPRFTMTCEFRLSETLKAMGMATAFSGDADFSGMTGTRRLFISEVVHKAFVEVNEEGTEAAAATGVVMKRVSMPAEPIVFRADHPFLFLIREVQSGTILFMGRLVKPPAAAGSQ